MAYPFVRLRPYLSRRFGGRRQRRRLLCGRRRIQHQAQRPISRREEINRISREEDNDRDRDQRHQVQKYRKYNASHHHSQGNGKDIPRQARGLSRQHGDNSQPRRRNRYDQHENQRNQTDGDPGSDRQDDFHEHIYRVAALFRLDHGPQTPPTLHRADPLQCHLWHHEILGQHVNHSCKQKENERQEKHHDPAQHQRQHMLSGCAEPSHGISKGSRDSQEHQHPAEGSQHVGQLPQEILPPGGLSTAPSLPDVTFLRQHTVEENESHHAADIRHDDHEDEAGYYEGGDESAQDRGVDFRQPLLKELARRSRLMRKGRRDVEASTGAHLPGQ